MCIRTPKTRTRDKRRKKRGNVCWPHSLRTLARPDWSVSLSVPRPLYFAILQFCSLLCASLNCFSILYTVSRASTSSAMMLTDPAVVFSVSSLSSSFLSIAPWAAFTSSSVALRTALLAFSSRRIATESASAFTLQATRSWAVAAETCFAAAISFSSLAFPCTKLLAASHRLWVAAATSLAADTRPSDHWPSSDPMWVFFWTLPWATSSFCASLAALIKDAVALAMDLAASRIISSNCKSSSATLLAPRFQAGELPGCLLDALSSTQQLVLRDQHRVA